MNLFFKFSTKLSKYILFLSFIFYFFSFIFYIPNVYAEDNFITDYHIIYTVAENGMTNVVMDVTLTNAADDYSYASSYSIQLGFENISNVKASDLGGFIDPKVEKNEDGNNISIKFNQKAVGIGSKQFFSISFLTPDIAKKQGEIWEINIPGIANQDTFDSFDVDLQVPNNFGKPAYIKPRQESDTLHFTKEQLSTSGISVAFGEKQTYEFSLIYHLNNKNLFPIRTEIALPPNTNYQEINIDSMTPEPKKVEKDTDGNWLAEYELLPGESKDVWVTGKAQIFLQPKKEILSEEELAHYLKTDQFWEIENEKIKSKAQSLRTPEAIYSYVVDTLTYDFSRVTSNKNRLGAQKVISDPKSAVCLEFTDLFIALARAAGIPAREVDGYAYTENQRDRPLSLVQDILHAWPEYYDREKEMWIMVDPTWGNTTGGVDYFHVLDFDHLAFVKRGVSSTYPIPAGGYKNTGDENKKDIAISFSEKDISQSSTITLEPYIASSYTAGFPIDGTITVINKGPAVSTSTAVSIFSSTLLPGNQKSYVKDILPFGRKTVRFQFQKLPFLTNATHTITISDGKNEFSKTIEVIPFLVKDWKLKGGIIGAILAFIIFIFAIKTRRLPISRRK